MLFFRARLDILTSLTNLGRKCSCVILELYLKKKEFIIFFLRFVYFFCCIGRICTPCTDVLPPGSFSRDMNRSKRLDLGIAAGISSIVLNFLGVQISPDFHLTDMLLSDRCGSCGVNVKDQNTQPFLFFVLVLTYSLALVWRATPADGQSFRPQLYFACHE